MRTFSINGLGVAAFDPQWGTRGRALLSGPDGSIQQWDLEHAESESTYAHPEKGATAIAVSDDGDYVLFASADGTLERRSHTILGPESWHVLRAHKGEVSKVALSQDGSIALSRGWDGKTVLWHVNDSAAPRILEQAEDWDVGSVALSPDGRLAVSTSGRAWSTTTGDPAPGFERCLSAGQASWWREAVAFSPDGSEVAFGTAGAIYRCDVATRKLLSSLRIESLRVAHAIAYMRFKKRLFVAFGNGVIAWDTERNEIVQQFPRRPGDLSDVAFTQDGRYLLCMDTIRIASLWDIQEAKQVIAPTQTGEVGRYLREHGLVLDPSHSNLGGQATGTRLSLAVQEDGRIELRDRETGKFVRQLGTHGGSLLIVAALSGDDRRALTANFHDVRLWDVPSSTLMQKFRGTLPVVFSPDSRMMAFGNHDSNVELRTAAGEFLRRLSGHTNHIFAAAFSPDSRHLATVSPDGTIRLWRTDNGNSMTFVAADGEWLVYTDDGYFDASRGGGGLVATVDGLRGYRIDQMALRNNRPDLILEQMALGTAEFRAHLRAVHDVRIRKLGVDPSLLGSNLRGAPRATIVSAFRYGKRVKIECDFFAPFFGLSSYNVYVNGVPLHPGLGVAIDGYRQRVTIELELTAGPNRIEVGAFSKAGIESLRDVRVEDYTEPVESDLYFLGIGVSSYQRPQPGQPRELDRKGVNTAKIVADLRFAREDALALGQLFKHQKGHFQHVHVRTIVDDKATRQGILDAHAFLRRASIDDTVIVFLSGHGVYSRDDEGMFHFLPHDGDPSQPRSTAVSRDQIEGLLEDVPARRKLVLLDACESGERDPDTFASDVRQAQQLGLNPRPDLLVPTVVKPRTFLFDHDRYVYNHLSRRTGAIIFSSSRGAELSYERAALKHGLFTHEILLALTTNVADADASGTVSLDELRNYVSTQVSQASGQLQHPTFEYADPDVEIELPVVVFDADQADKEYP